MHRRNDGKPFNAWRADKWTISAEAAGNRAILNNLPDIRVSRFRVMLASFIMWLFSKLTRR